MSRETEMSMKGADIKQNSLNIPGHFWRKKKHLNLYMNSGCLLQFTYKAFCLFPDEVIFLLTRTVSEEKNQEVGKYKTRE